MPTNDRLDGLLQEKREQLQSETEHTLHLKKAVDEALPFPRQLLQYTL